MSNQPEQDGELQMIHAPVEFIVEPGDDDLVSLKFGPMPMDDLAATLVQLGTPEGQSEFLDTLYQALKQKVEGNLL